MGSAISTISDTVSDLGSYAEQGKGLFKFAGDVGDLYDRATNIYNSSGDKGFWGSAKSLYNAASDKFGGAGGIAHYISDTAFDTAGLDPELADILFRIHCPYFSGLLLLLDKYLLQLLLP